MNTLYLDLRMGAAGDMLTASLFELLPAYKQDEFLDTMNNLGLARVAVCALPKSDKGVNGTHMEVTINGIDEGDLYVDGHDEHDHVHEERCNGHHHENEGDQEHPHHDHNHTHAHNHHGATPHEINHLVSHLDLPSDVKEGFYAVYDKISNAEALAHGTSVSQIHFHEVGEMDAITDVVGVCLIMSMLPKPLQIIASPVNTGSGTVICAHGEISVPAPATKNILKDRIPYYTDGTMGELLTPTGAALLSHFVDYFGVMPEMEISNAGFGIGKKTFDKANCVRSFLGDAKSIEKESCEGDASIQKRKIVELSANIDDMTGEEIAFACKAILECGALDCYTIPGTMKKGRPGVLLTVLCEEENEENIAKVILKNTSTIGLKAETKRKYYLSYKIESVLTEWGPVRIKVAFGDGIYKAKPEFEDVAKLAEQNDLPFTVISQAAMDEFES